MATRRIKTYAHGCDDHNADLYLTYNLPNTIGFSRGFAYAFDEFDIVADVDLDTGVPTIVEIRYGKQILRPIEDVSK